MGKNLLAVVLLVITLAVLASLIVVLISYALPSQPPKQPRITSFSVISSEIPQENINTSRSCNEMYSSKKDSDRDGLMDKCDNCPEYYNPNQEDDNKNRIGEICEFVLAERGHGGGGGSITIACNTNSDCGVDFPSALFCLGNQIIQNFTSVTCNAPSSSSSYCSNTTQAVLNQTCSSACFQGQCVSVACNTNSDCGTDFPSAPFCTGNNITRLFTTFTCQAPGTLSSSCSNSTQPILVQQCTNGCSNGQCINVTPSIACFNNQDCGIDGFSSSQFCSGNAITQNFTTFTCNAQGTSNSFCSNTTTPQLIFTCPDSCNNGQCVSVACSSNSDCGTDFLSGPLCSGDNVIRNFINYTCNVPGTFLSSCSNQSGSLLVQSCQQNQSCVSGECILETIECFNDLECGFTGFFGENFCASNSVYKNFQNAACQSPGTFQSKCNINTSQILVRDCNDNNPLTTDICVQPISGPAFCQNVLM